MTKRVWKRSKCSIARIAFAISLVVYVSGFGSEQSFTLRSNDATRATKTGSGTGKIMDVVAAECESEDFRALDYDSAILTKGKIKPEEFESSKGLESRRMFVGLLATSIGASLVGTDPEPAVAKEPVPFFDLSTKSSNQYLNSAENIVSEVSTIELSEAVVVDWNGIFQKASKRALGGGKAGASAAVIQVLSLMWLRTSMNRQYRYGGDLGSSLKELWNEGGIPRLYQGLPFALVQGPLTRFGDTAANVGVLALLESLPKTQSLPLPIKTGLGSISAGLWRIFLMPIDSSKTAMQVEGENGLKELLALVGKEGPGPLYNGALAQAAATAAGHFPWFLTYNYVDQTLPIVTASDDLLLSLVRSAFLGLCASCVSDVTSNSLRVIKTTKQTARLGGPSLPKYEASTGIEEKQQSNVEYSYVEIVKMIVEKDGLGGLFGRGLKTRLLTNALQGALFSVLFKYFQQV